MEERDMKLKRLNAKQVVKLLRSTGWALYDQVGSHMQFKHPSIPGKVTVPFHKELNIGTLCSIFKQAGMY